jgi:PAS domain S-box-containing protein
LKIHATTGARTEIVMLDHRQFEDLLDTALTALAGGDGFAAVLDQLPVPIYTTDAQGQVSYWNRACIDFAGREPELGKDRWCVTWRLYTMEGEFLPHDECPMAAAIKTKQPIRQKVAIAMRPDGSRVAFRPYPTPLFDAEGNFTGAINMLVDISAEQIGTLKDQARRCRRLASATTDREAGDILRSMAGGYEATAEALGCNG